MSHRTTLYIESVSEHPTSYCVSDRHDTNTCDYKHSQPLLLS